MDQITHKFIQVNGLNLHVAEAGSESSPPVIFLHGFPEIWYSWRHQMLAVATAGFRAIAPDFRGYGLSDAPPEPEKACLTDLVHDTASLLDSLAISSKAFVVAKDFGGWIAYGFALLYPEKVAGIITANVMFMPPGAFADHFVFPEGFYVSRWQKPERTEADFGRFDVKTVVRKIYIMFCGSEMPIAGENEEIMDLVKPSAPLPSWMTEEDIAIYGTLYEKNGFRTALQATYRTMHMPGSEIQDPKIQAPTLVILGGKDYLMKVPGMKEYIQSDSVKKYVRNHETVYVPEGCHFLQEQFPDHVNELIIAFLNRNKHVAVV